ncbi:MAG TPA: hypothetical protein VFO41_06840, partial [Alphaproteobacteria bacterium]|nr:hypothetical protein [Alphaproteobacteria bacterium]
IDLGEADNASARFGTPTEDAVILVGTNDDAGVISDFWRYDLATGTTTRLTDDREGTSTFIYDVLKVGDDVLFTTAGPDGPFAMSRLDPVTGEAADLAVGSETAPGAFGDYAAAGDQLYFTVQDGTDDHSALWRYDSNTDGAELVADVYEGVADAGVQEFVLLGDDVLFTAKDGTGGSELWHHDGATGETALVADPRSDGYARIGELTVVGDYVYFTADDGVRGEELWAYEASSGTADVLVDLVPGRTGSNPSHLTEADGVLYFAAGTAGSRQLYRYDAEIGDFGAINPDGDVFSPGPIASVSENNPIA